MSHKLFPGSNFSGARISILSKRIDVEEASACRSEDWHSADKYDGPVHGRRGCVGRDDRRIGFHGAARILRAVRKGRGD